MSNNITVSIYLDTRRAKQNDKYPVKLKVYQPEGNTRKYYPIGFEFTIKEFDSIWNTSKTRKEFKEIKDELNSIQVQYSEIVKKINPFSFNEFEKKAFLKSTNNENDVSGHYNETIERLRKNKQFGTASCYYLCLKSLLAFHNKKKLQFSEITPSWLNEYENYMIDNGKSKTTVSIYLRTLRTIFNNAIAEKFINPEIYPFGKRKYVIPSPKAVKKALSKEQLKTLFESIPQTPEQEKAKDFWFLSYACSGVNMKDILNWKWKNLNDDVLIFNRAKTINTKKDQKPIVIHLNDFSKSIVQKYAKQGTPESLIFPILNTTDSPEKNFRQVKNFTKFINQNLLKLAKSIGINEPISTYWARHSFTTTAINRGASLEFIGEALGHSDMKTTIGYFAGFESEAKKLFSQSLMEF